MPTLLRLGEIQDIPLRAVAQRLARTIQIVAEKAVANTIDPLSHPLPPQTGALENRFSQYLNSLPEYARKEAADGLAPSIRASDTARHALYKELAAIKLRSSESVFSQAKKIPLATPLPTVEHIQSLRLVGGLTPADHAMEAPREALSSHIEVAPNRVALRVHAIECLDETNSILEPEWVSADDIYLGGQTIDEQAQCNEISLVQIGKFNDGTVKTFDTPLPFARFNTKAADSSWPKLFTAVLLLVERDMGDAAKFLDDLLDQARAQAAAILAPLIAAGIPPALQAQVIAELTAFVIDKVYAWLKQWWGDEIFAPVSLAVSMASESDHFENHQTPDQVVRFAGHRGEYELTYDWQLYREFAMPA